MDYYKKICVGNNEVLYDLVKEFNLETKDGKNMKKYSKLLANAISDILGKKEEIGVDSLFGGERTILTSTDIDGFEEFELITFLILK